MRDSCDVPQPSRKPRSEKLRRDFEGKHLTGWFLIGNVRMRCSIHLTSVFQRQRLRIGQPENLRETGPQTTRRNSQDRVC